MNRLTMAISSVPVGLAILFGFVGGCCKCRKEKGAEFSVGLNTGLGSSQTDAGTPSAPPDAGAPTPIATADAGANPGTGGDAGSQVDPITLQALEAQIEERAKTKDAKGMTAQGAVFGGVLAEGGKIESPVFMVERNQCVGVVAEGGVGVRELDVKIVAAAVPLETVVAVDNTVGPSAAVTPCWKNVTTIGFPAKVILVARSGSGPVAGKVFAK